MAERAALAKLLQEMISELDKPVAPELLRERTPRNLLHEPELLNTADIDRIIKHYEMLAADPVNRNNRFYDIYMEYLEKLKSHKADNPQRWSKKKKGKGKRKN